MTISIQIIRKEQIAGTARHIRNETYETYRFLLDSDLAGVTVTDILLSPHIEETYGYENHIELAYCIEGNAELIDISDGQTYSITSGTLWVAKRGDKFKFHASIPTRLICVFSPPFSGHETGFAGDQ